MSFNRKYVVFLAAIFFFGCTPKVSKQTTPPRPLVGPVAPAIPGPTAPHSRPVDPAQLLTLVPPRRIIIPETILPGLVRPVSVDSRGGPAAEVIRQWSEGCRINVALHPGLFPGSSPRQFPLWLTIEAMPARAALEWICRLCDASYVILKGGLWIVPDYRWLANEPVKTHIDLVGGLYAPAGGDLENYLYQSQRVFLENNPSCRLMLQPTTGNLLTVLPDDGYEMVRTVLYEIESHAPFRASRDQLPTAILIPPPSPSPRAVVSSDALRRRLHRTMRVFYKNADVQDILSDLIRRTGVNMAFDYRKIPESRRRLTFSLGYVPAETLLNELVDRAYQKRVDWELDRGLWIYPEGQTANHRRTLHQAWQRVVFRSYPARDLVLKKPKRIAASGGADSDEPPATIDRLMNYVKEKVGGNWDEPAYAIGYSEPAGRLLLQHEVEVHLQIPSILDAYRAALKLRNPLEHLLPPGAAGSSRL